MAKLQTLRVTPICSVFFFTPALFCHKNKAVSMSASNWFKLVKCLTFIDCTCGMENDNDVGFDYISGGNDYMLNGPETKVRGGLI